eukprot:gnl/Trimastix_PCT/3157.p1 GENE.gnl/Trimastix_PCT/3157~~gnl/Trimastix_PCT/3157.p1  ORF type:complete len:400 (+),score=32.75 gnl/Trimastix_PCT/3157:123-1322(+)
MRILLLFSCLFFTSAFCIDLIQIRTLINGTGLNSHNASDIIGPYDRLQFANPADHSLSCCDGRSLSPILGTPGGDFGEFLLGLWAVAQEGLNVTASHIQMYLTQFIVHSGNRRFYWHSSQTALEYARDQLSDPSFDPLVAPSDVQAERRVLGVIAQDPQAIGCRFIAQCVAGKLTLHSHSTTHTPMTFQQMAMNAVEAFYRMMWHSDAARSRVDFPFLHGTPHEQAIIQINTHEKPSQAYLEQESSQPVISPRSLAMIHHPATATAFRHILSHFLAELLITPNTHTHPHTQAHAHTHNLALSEIARGLKGNMDRFAMVVQNVFLYQAQSLPVYEVHIFRTHDAHYHLFLAGNIFWLMGLSVLVVGLAIIVVVQRRRYRQRLQRFSTLAVDDLPSENMLQ